MRVGILGSGDVAKSFGRGFLNEGYEVRLGSRDPAKLAGWVRESGPRASSGSLPETARFGELVVLAVQGTKSVEAIQAAGVEAFTGKVVLDSTNPLETAPGGVPKLVGGPGSSSGELNQRAVPAAFVVKAFNTVGHAQFYKPQFAGGPPDMFVCGDDANAKARVARLCTDFGWNAIDTGSIGMSHYLEAAAMIWILTAYAGGHWHQAFKMLRA